MHDYYWKEPAGENGPQYCFLGGVIDQIVKKKDHPNRCFLHEPFNRAVLYCRSLQKETSTHDIKLTGMTTGRTVQRQFGSLFVQSATSTSYESALANTS